jgi:hypothetical protein
MTIVLISRFKKNQVGPDASKLTKAIRSDAGVIIIFFLKVLPLVIYGIVLLCTGIMSIWIWPETNSIKLPDTMQEAEEVAASKNPWLSCTCIKCGAKK